MGGIKEEVAKKLPEGSTVGEIYTDPADPKKIIIEYTRNNKVYRITPERININTLFDYRKSVAMVEGLTFNDLYEIVSKRHALDLVNGIDYEDNPELVTETGRYRLPTHPNSLRFIPGGFNVDVIEPNTAITGTEDERDLSDYNLLPSTEYSSNSLRSLAVRLYDFKDITCFENGQLTVAFRQAVADSISESFPEMKKEVLGSFLLKGFSDALSDAVLLAGPSEIPYIIRYESAEGDIP